MRLQCVEHQCNGWDVVCAPWSHGFATGHNLTVKSGLGWWHVLSLTIFISTRHNRDLNLNWDSREDNILWQNLFWCWVINFHTTLTHSKHHWSELGTIIHPVRHFSHPSCWMCQYHVLVGYMSMNVQLPTPYQQRIKGGKFYKIWFLISAIFNSYKSLLKEKSFLWIRD